MIQSYSENASHPGVAAGLQEGDGSGRWYVLLVLVLGYGVHNLDKQIISILVEPLKLEFGMTDFQVSMLGGLAASLPFALLCIPMGMLADRWNRKFMLVILIVAWSLATVLGGFATTLLLLFLSRALVGGLEAGFSPLSMSLIADHFHPRERSTALGFFAIGAPLGTFLALVLGAYVASHLGWRWAFFLAGVPGVLLALLIACTIKEPPRGRFEGRRQQPAIPLAAALRCLYADRALLNTILGMVFCVTLLASIAIWFPTFLVRVHELELRQAGFWSAIVVGGTGALGAAVGGIAADWFSKGNEARKLSLIMVSVLLSAACLVSGMLFSSSLLWTLVLVGCSAFLTQVVFGTGYSLVIRLAESAMRATVLALLVVVLNLVSYSLGSSMAGWISDQFAGLFGARSIAYGVASTGLFSVVGVLLFYRVRRLLQTRGM